MGCSPHKIQKTEAGSSSFSSSFSKPAQQKAICCTLNRKRWRATAVHDAGAFSNGLRTSRSVLECASPLALFFREPAGVTEKAARCWPRRYAAKAACRVEAQHRRKLTPPNYHLNLLLKLQDYLTSNSILENPRAGVGIDISPMPAAPWPNVGSTFAPAGKRTALASRTVNRIELPRP